MRLKYINQRGAPFEEKMRLKAILSRSSTRSTHRSSRSKQNSKGNDNSKSTGDPVNRSSDRDGYESDSSIDLLSAPRRRTQKPRRYKDAGDLIFNSDFESGNVGRVVRCSAPGFEYDYDISIRADTNNSKYRVWFHFTVSNVRARQRVIFHINNYSKTRALFRDGLTPVVKASYSMEWQRLPADQIFHYRCPHHGRRQCISFTFQFDRTDAHYTFAYSFPYTYSYLQRFLQRLDSKDLAFYKRELLCRTVQHRRLDLITITDPKNLTQASSKRKSRVVAITARVHPGESPASIVAHGMIQFLCSQDSNAKLLRKNIIFCIIPMLNPDGVCLGNHRCSSMGTDLNRCWTNPEWWSQPTIRMSKDLFVKLANDPFVSMDVIIDIHAHTNARSGFMYCNGGEGTDLQKGVEMEFPRLLHNRFPQFDLSSTRFEDSATKKGTSRRALGDFLPGTRCYTLEVSFLGYCPEGASNPILYYPHRYKEVGKSVAETFIDYYGLISEESSVPQKSHTNVECDWKTPSGTSTSTSSLTISKGAISGQESSIRS